MKRGLLIVWCILAFLFFGADMLVSKVKVGEEVLETYETQHPYPSKKGVVWEQTFNYPGAAYIAVHFSHFHLAGGDYVEVAGPSGQHVYTYRGKGKKSKRKGEDGGEKFLSTFWAAHIPGETAVVRLISRGKQPHTAYGFTVDKWVRGYEKEYIDALMSGDKQPGVIGDESLIGDKAQCDTDDKEWAPCYQGTEIYNKSRAVCRLLINGSIGCTGFLLGSQGHVMTNNHCIETQADADNTDYEFMAEGATCYTDCSSSGSCPGIIEANSGELIRTSYTYDYSLIRIPTNVTWLYGFLQFRETGEVLHERIYIPQHPWGYGKQLAVLSDMPGPLDYADVQSSDAGSCWGNGRNIGYYADTDHGSSGSPVIAYGDHLVVGVHHCGECLNTGVAVPGIIADLGDDLPLQAVGGGYVTVTSPNGGENLRRGDTVNITWDASNYLGDVKIVLRRNGQLVANIATGIDAGQETFAWEVGTTVDGVVDFGDQYKIKIREQGTSTWDESNAAFTIYGLDVTAPNGGEAWELKETENITWDAGHFTGNVQIALRKGADLVGTVAVNVDPSLGTYPWEVGKIGALYAPAGTGYFIRVRQMTGEMIYDDGDGTFEIFTTQGTYPTPNNPAPLPGTVQAENYDTGGEGIAYHDTTPGNICNPAANHRGDDVDLQSCTDGGNGYNVGYIAAGEWLEYTVMVTGGGYYDFDVRCASLQNGAFHIEMNGATVVDHRGFTSTGGSQTWKTITVPRVYLSSGQKVMRFYAENSNFNLNYITVRGSVQAPFNGVKTIPGTVQAEDYDIGGQNISYYDTTAGNICHNAAYRFDDVDVENASGSIVNAGYIAVGEWLEYTVDNSVGRNYYIEAKVAAPTGGQFSVEADGNVLKTVTIAASGQGGQDYATVTSSSFYLPKGKITIRVNMLQALWNFDYFRFIAN